MKKVTLLLSVMVVTLLAASGVALAAVFIGTDGPDRIDGTNRADSIKGLGAGDLLVGNGGNDSVRGGTGGDLMGDGGGQDVLYGGRGADTLIAFDDSANDTFSGGPGDDDIQSRNVPAVRDTVNCGTGEDVVFADSLDVVADDCENVELP